MSNRIGKFYDLADDSRGIATQTLIGVDENEMSATALISTPDWDRQNDSLNPLGGNYDNYKLNPLVYWEHGKHITVPIAKSDNADGELMVFPSQDGIRATSYFSNRNKQSEQFFNLIADGIIRAASIRFKPLKAPITKSMGAGQFGHRFDEWEKEEWSWCGLAVNPKAVREVIAKGNLAGSQIDGSIMKSLQSLIPETTTTRTVGRMLPEDYQMTKDIELDITTDQPLGSQVIHACHSHLKAVEMGLDATMPRLENQQVTDLLNRIKGVFNDIHNALIGGHAEAYPGSEMKSFIATSEPEESPDESETRERMKSFLAVSMMDRHKLGGLNEQLEALATADNLSSRQKSLVVNLNNEFGSIVKSAYEAHGKPPEPTARETELADENTRLRSELESLLKSYESAIPHPRV